MAQGIYIFEHAGVKYWVQRMPHSIPDAFHVVPAHWNPNCASKYLSDGPHIVISSRHPGIKNRAEGEWRHDAAAKVASNLLGSSDEALRSELAAAREALSAIMAVTNWGSDEHDIARQALASHQQEPTK